MTHLRSNCLRKRIRHGAMREGTEQPALSIHMEITGGPNCRRTDVARKYRILCRKLIQNLCNKLWMDRFSFRFPRGQIIQAPAGLDIVAERCTEMRLIRVGSQLGDERGDGSPHIADQTQVNFCAAAMLMGDLLSLRQLQLPVKLIVFNNSSLAFVELEMKAAGILDFGTDLQNPDFAKMSEAAGVLGLRAETSDQVRPMIEQALRHDGPALVEAIVSRQELSMPPTITIDQIKGFSLFMIKAVLDGRGNEIIDLAKTNLVR